jgi:hypothetical protein
MQQRQFMSKQVRLRRGTTAQHATFTGADGEVSFDTDKKCLVTHDGITPGGKPVDAVRLNPGGAGMVSQTMQSGLNILGDGDDGLALYVAKNAQVNGTFSVQGMVNLNGGVHVAGEVWFNSPFVLQLIRIPEDLPWASPFLLNFGLYAGYRITLAGNLAFTTQGLSPSRRMTVVLLGDGSPRTLTWPADWRWIGTTAPATLAANKIAWLELLSTTATDAGVLARWSVEG